MLIFPDIEPNLASASNSGSSYKEEWVDSTIESTTDALYKKTRPRTTRTIRRWSFSWVGLEDEKYRKITDFYQQVTTAQQFLFLNPIDGNTYTVRIKEMSAWQWYVYGWQGSIVFEEV